MSDELESEVALNDAFALVLVVGGSGASEDCTSSKSEPAIECLAYLLIGY
jgi:hypothetical protein